MRRVIKSFFRIFLSLLPLIVFPRLNVWLNRLLGYKLDRSVRIYSSVQIRGNINVEIGANTYIGHETIITGGAANIHIGANCDISDRVAIICGTHEIDPVGERSAGKCIGKDVYIEDGVWIGFGSIILPGVKVGKKAIIAGGTVVNKDVPEFTIVGGNPMRVIRSFNSNLPEISGVTTSTQEL